MSSSLIFNDNITFQVTYVIDYYDGGDVGENFEFSLLDVRPKMTNWSEIRKVTDLKNWQNWRHFTLHTEAIIDRAKVLFFNSNRLVKIVLRHGSGVKQSIGMLILSVITLPSK